MDAFWFVLMSGMAVGVWSWLRSRMAPSTWFGGQS